MYQPPEMLFEQARKIPEIYGKMDFTITPERFAGEVDDQSELGNLGGSDRRPGLLGNAERVAKIRAYTMMGDMAADAYAALMPKYGFRPLVTMLEQACDAGLEAVENPPQALVDLIHAMEDAPDWLDMALVEEGAKLERNSFANLAPYAIRGTFLATFMNKYAALPMAMTGTLSNSNSAGRVKETANFFTTTVMPGALERHGAGFKAAAKVRLMHSMVRFHIMRTNKWDVSIYGAPIPQVDQMPAGMIGMFLLSMDVLRSGRTQFTPEEQAKVELSRYRCFLLGLPEDLLADTPQEIVDLLLTRQATLRKGWDDSTCGELVRSTVTANIANENLLKGTIRQRMELSLSKILLVRNFCEGDYSVAEGMGVHISSTDKLVAVLSLGVLHARLGVYKLAALVPGLGGWTDRRLVKKLNRLLEGYGHADFESDADHYKPAPGVKKRPA